jgi:S1-C subfamily serine protease
MEEIVLMDSVERYLKGEMSPSELAQFENLRRENADVDQLVVEQQMFLQQLDHYGQRRDYKHQLHQLHNNLLESGEIKEIADEDRGATVIELWRKYKRTIAVAASIAGITALTISGSVHLLTPKSTRNDLQQLNRKMNELEGKTRQQDAKLNQLISTPVKSPGAPQKSGGTGFLIDGKGYLVTNSHVINGASTLVVVNKGREYIARNVYNDVKNDLAILKIEDQDWKPVSSLPYNIRKGSVDLGEEIFTLGYPRNEVVYNRGYMSSRSGYNDDTLSIQIAISANPGNSGGPLLDRNGDVIGILSTRDKMANEVVFGSKAINIYKAIEDLKKDSANLNIKLPSSSSLKGMDRVQQIKKLQDCVFMVKGY